MEKGTKNNRKRVWGSLGVLILILLTLLGIKFCKDNRPHAPVPSQPSSSVESIDSLSLSSPKDTVVPSYPEPETIVTVTQGMTLRNLARKYYGNSLFWPYIYEENKDRIQNVHLLPIGTRLVIPPKEKYGIDPEDPESVARARKKAAEILAMPGQERSRRQPQTESRSEESAPKTVIPADTLSREEEIRPATELEAVTDSIKPLISETPQEDPGDVPAVEPSKLGIPVMSLKTNLLEWCGLIINGEIEWYFARHFSLNAEYNYAKWRFKNDYRQWRGGVISPEFRYWFSPDLFRRHYLGIYGQLGEYNVKPKKYGYQGDFYTVGLSYGYSFLLNPHLNLELGIGVGYMRTKYDKYIQADDCYPYLNTTTKEYWGVTKLKVSLVYNFWIK